MQRQQHVRQQLGVSGHQRTLEPTDHARQHLQRRRNTSALARVARESRQKRDHALPYASSAFRKMMIQPVQCRSKHHLLLRDVHGV
eukprot:4642563-Pyramimonas_sp.AAC.1